MRKSLLTLIIILLVASVVSSADRTALSAANMANTFSIVCYDSASGEFGAAVQSHWFKVNDVIWAEAGVGAVATQSLTEISYGPLGLDLMRAGKTANEALAGLLAADSNNAVRQVAMIDTHGNVVAHSGSKCIAEFGQHIGKNYSCQANLMEKNTVWDAMAKAFESTKGDLAERMMAALEAAQGQGGDIRGKQSAAMLVVSGKPTGKSWVDRKVDLRVDDSPEPLKELRRLLNINRAYDHMNRGDEYIAVKNWDSAAYEYQTAAELDPGNKEILFWYAAALVTAGQVEKSLPVFKQVFKEGDNWRQLVPRLVTADLLPHDSTVIQQIMAQ